MKYNEAQFIRHTLAGLFTVGLIIIGLTYGPPLHRQILANDLKRNVLRLSDLNDRSGGTGFYAQTPSGNTVIITNSHVCARAKAMLLVEPFGDEWKFTRTKVIKDRPYVDLCALEAINKNVRGLELATSESVFEDSFTFRYPAGFEYFAKGITQRRVWVNEIQYNVTEAECPGEFKDFRKALVESDEELKSLLTLLSNKIETGCRVKNNLLMISNLTYPGSSGSPTVDEYGNLIGVVARHAPEILAGLIVPLSTVREFLSDL